jgi:hypothetical protein
MTEDEKQRLGRAALSLKQHLFGIARDRGFIGIADTGTGSIIVYAHASKRRWREPMLAEWEGYPVSYRFNVGPIVALGGIK